MADFSYSSAPDESDPISVVRFNLPDTDANDPLLTDSEISFILSIQPALRYATAAAAGIIAGKFAKMVDTTIGETRVMLSQKYEHWKDREATLLAKKGGIFPGELGGTAAVAASIFVGGISIAGKEQIHSNVDFDPEGFSIGQDDNNGGSF